MSQRTKGVLLTLAEVALCLGVVCFLLLAWLHFDTAGHVSEMKPWLISEADPTAVSAMTTLEEEQFKWRLGGGLYVLRALPLLGVEITLRLHRRKQRRNTDEHQTLNDP